ncbi:MAG: TonB-dependent receptor [Xanthomonadales bacterium]|nr:TonB-dependent receptor [Xanthomonadales bacterium]
MNIPRRLLLPTVISSLLASGPLLAQSDNDTDTTLEEIEEIVVTGSRIRQDPLEMRTPVQVLSERDLERSGQVSLAEFVQKLPISGSAINRTNNSSGNLGFPPDGAGIGAGAAEIDLRYLQSKRVLVLVDGRRWVRGSSASGVSGAVDLNTIPANAIKAIEILQDGASAVYGTDAIGGVVNIITEDNYDQFKVSAYYSEYDDGDGESSEFDVAWGASSDVARVFLDISYTDQGDVGAADRAISRESIFGAPFPGASSGTPEGRFIFTDPRTGQTLNITPTTQFPAYDPNDPTAGGFKGFTNDDRFNYQPFNFILTPNQRTSVFAKAEYDITDTTTLRMLASYNNRESTSRAAPEPLFFGPAGGGGAFMESLFWPADHPFNPFGVDLGPDEIVFFGRRPIEAGARIFDQNVDTFYISAGADGSFDAGGRIINWDVTAIWAQNQANQRKRGAFNARNLILGLGPTEDCAAVPGCVPVNIVGAGSLTQEMLDFVTFIQKDESEQELRDFTANFTGEFGGLEAGDIGWALGYEYREEEGFFIPDSVVTAGETAGVPASPTAGSFDVDELYGEVVVPLLADVQGAHRLDLSAAFRWSDYELFGSDTVGKVGLNWAPIDNFVVRANFSEGLRAPNIGELFNTGSRFDSSINDPCSNADPSVAANCQQLGVPADFVTINPQIGVTTGGNPDLNPETSDTLTLGFAWDVAAVNNWDGIDQLTIEANYYDIEIEDAIQAPNAQDLVNGCVNTLAPIFCNAITRAPDGTITRVDGILANIGGIETDGFDLSVRMDTAEYNWGRLSFNWVSTFLGDYTEITQGPDGPVATERAGTELGSPERAFIETKSTLHTDWYYGDWDVRLSIRYLSSIDEACGGATGDFGLFELCSRGADGNTLGSTTYVDTQVTWAPSDLGDGNWAFQFGIDNLFDEDPPVCRSCDLNSWDGTAYPLPGQVWYGRVSYSLD